MNKVKRYRYEKWFWVVMVLPTVIWFGRSTLFVSLISIYALVISSAAAEEAAQAADKQEP